MYWTKEAKKIFPGSEIILFEAMEEVEFMYSDHRYHIGVLTHTDNFEVDFYQNTEFPGGNSYYREIGHPDSEKLFNKSVKKTGMTLQSIVKAKGFPTPDLIKIDVQGCELDILKGSMDLIKQCKWLIIELQKIEYNKGAPLKDTTIQFLESNSFKLVTPEPFCDNGPDGDYFFENKNNM